LYVLFVSNKKVTCYIKHVTSNSNALLRRSNKHNTGYIWGD